MKLVKQFLFAGIAFAFIISGCSKKNNPDPQNQNQNQNQASVLAITGVSPASAVVGATVTITGTAFGTDANAVSIKFGASAAVHPLTVSATQLTVLVPQDATTGYITVIVGGKTVIGSSFTVTVTPPPFNIAGFAPSSAEIGATVTISGAMFSADANAVSVKFGNSAAVHPLTISSTQLTVIVPQGATTGKIAITINNATVTSNTDLRVIAVADYSTFNAIASVSTAKLSVARSGLACAAAGTKIVFAGGSTDGHGGGLSDAVDIYDVVSKTWSTAKLSEPRYLLAATSAGNKLFFAGGINASSSYSKTIDIYDVSTNTWTTAQLSEGRSSLGATSYGNKVYFAGGQNQAYGNSTIIDIYDITTDTWKTSQLGRGISWLTGVSTNGIVAFAGGTDELRNPIGYLAAYDAVANPLLNMSGGLGYSVISTYHTAAAANSGKIVVAGAGFYGSVVDTKTQTVSRANFTVGYIDLAMAAAGTKIILAGGTYNTNVVSIYDVLTDTWDTTFPLSEPRSLLAGGALNNQVVFAGGNIPGGTSATVDIYTLTKK